jgi:hypothetical protein
MDQPSQNPLSKETRKDIIERLVFAHFMCAGAHGLVGIVANEEFQIGLSKPIAAGIGAVLGSGIVYCFAYFTKVGSSFGNRGQDRTSILLLFSFVVALFVAMLRVFIVWFLLFLPVLLIAAVISFACAKLANRKH